MNGPLGDIRLLTAKPAPSGRKGDAASIVRKNWERLGEAREDGQGNPSLTVGGGGARVAFVAHLDEVGFARRFPDGR